MRRTPDLRPTKACSTAAGRRRRSPPRTRRSSIPVAWASRSRGAQDGSAATATPVARDLRGSIRCVELPTGEKLIALTFDLCETNSAIAGYDGRIIDLLRAQGAKATFFASGKWLETHKERAEQLIADPNFELANHGFRHLDFARIAGRTLNDEIVLTETAYVRARKALLARECASGGEELQATRPSA